MPSDDKQDAIDLLNQIGDAAGVSTGLPRDQAAEDQKRWQRQTMTHGAPTPRAAAIANMVKQTPESLYRASPFNTEPRPIGENLSNIASSFLAPGVGKLAGPVQSIVRKVGPKLLQVAKEHPKEVMTLLGALGVGTGARAGGESEFGNEGKPTEIQNTQMGQLDSDIEALQKWIDAHSGTGTTRTTPHGTVYRSGGTDPAAMASKTAEKTDKEKQRADLRATIAKQAANYEQASLPWEQRNRWFVPGMMAGSAALGGLPGGRYAAQLAREGKELTHLRSFGNMAATSLLGIPEGAVSAAVPEVLDVATGTPKAAKRAEENLKSADWWKTRPAAETMLAMGMSGLGGKVGNEVVSALKGGRAPVANMLGIARSPVTDIVDQIPAVARGNPPAAPAPKVDPLAAMKNLQQQAKPTTNLRLYQDTSGGWHHETGGFASGDQVSEFLAANPGYQVRPKSPRVRKPKVEEPDIEAVRAYLKKQGLGE